MESDEYTRGQLSRKKGRVYTLDYDQTLEDFKKQWITSCFPAYTTCILDANDDHPYKPPCLPHTLKNQAFWCQEVAKTYYDRSKARSEEKKKVMQAKLDLFEVGD